MAAFLHSTSVSCLWPSLFVVAGGHVKEAVASMRSSDSFGSAASFPSPETSGRGNARLSNSSRAQRHFSQTACN